MKTKKSFLSLVLLMLPMLFLTACPDSKPTSDDIQAQEQEKILKEGTAQTGMPAIVNFQERKLLKLIYELRDQANLTTYTYLENMNPVPVHGVTALGGKLTFMGESIGFGIPYATEYTNPQKIQEYRTNVGYAVLPQADPNGLFSPSSAEGTWVLMKDPNDKDVHPTYVEPRIVVSTFKFKPD